MSVLRVEHRGPLPVVVVEGHLGDEQVDDLIATVTQLLTGPGATVILDLTGMNYVNSSGLGGLIRVAAQANAQRQRIILAGPTDFVKDLFSLTRLDKFLEITGSVEEAAKAAATPRAG